MKFSERVNKIIKEKGLKKSWLSDALSMRYVDYWRKMKDNSFTKEEKADIEVLLGDDTPYKEALLEKAARKRELKAELKSL